MFRTGLRILSVSLLGIIIALMLFAQWRALVYDSSRGYFWAIKNGLSGLYIGKGPLRGPGWGVADYSPQERFNYFESPVFHVVAGQVLVSIPWWLALPVASAATALVMYLTRRRKIRGAFPVEAGNPDEAERVK